MHENEISMHKNEIIMHENETTMHGNDIFMHEIFYEWEYNAWKKCTAQFHMNISTTKESS